MLKSQFRDMISSNSYCDYLILHILQLNLVLANIYRPPDCPEVLFTQTLEFTSVFFRNLEEHGKSCNTYLVLGDFNFPFLKFSESENSWGIKKCNICDSDTVCTHNSSQKRQAEKLLDFSNEFFMDQYIKKPTRNKNILDLCFTNDQFLILNYQIITNSKLSDHFTICINLNYEKVKKGETNKKLNRRL